MEESHRANSWHIVGGVKFPKATIKGKFLDYNDTFPDTFAHTVMNPFLSSKALLPQVHFSVCAKQGLAKPDHFVVTERIFIVEQNIIDQTMNIKHSLFSEENSIHIPAQSPVGRSVQALKFILPQRQTSPGRYYIILGKKRGWLRILLISLACVTGQL
jgi:hypothetical protein